ncbi:MAG: 50S ribosomal protein L10, partial [Bacillota bacterium]
MPRPEKVAAVEEIREHLQSSKAVFVTDFRGLTVAQMTRLRRKLRESGTEYKV